MPIIAKKTIIATRYYTKCAIVKLATATKLTIALGRRVMVIAK